MVRVGDKRGAYSVLVGKCEGKSHLKDLGIVGRIILKWIFKMWDEEAWAGLIGSGQGQVAGACECGNEPSGSITCREFVD